MSTAPDATSAPQPLEDPPDVRVRSIGLRTGPVAAVWLPAERHRFSHTDLPTISPPAARILVATVASWSGTYPRSAALPFIIGIPASAMLSLRTTVRPASAPSDRSLIEQRQYH